MVRNFCAVTFCSWANRPPTPALDILDAGEGEEGEILSSSKARKKDRTAETSQDVQRNSKEECSPKNNEQPLG